MYNETVFKALDYIIYRAKYYGVKLILTLGDQWNTADSKINYLEWGNATDNTNLFFTSPTIQGYYKQHILTMLNRNVSQFAAQVIAVSRAQALPFLHEYPCTYFNQLWSAAIKSSRGHRHML